MDRDIESFLNMMDEMLTFDIIKYIVTMISNEKNMLIIHKEQALKKSVNKDIIKLCNTYYYHNNFIIYKNEYGQFILQNNNLNNKNISVYKRRYDDGNKLMLTNENNENEIVLFNENIDNENETPIIRKIHLDIFYM